MKMVRFFGFLLICIHLPTYFDNAIAGDAAASAAVEPVILAEASPLIGATGAAEVEAVPATLPAEATAETAAPAATAPAHVQNLPSSEAAVAVSAAAEKTQSPSIKTPLPSKEDVTSPTSAPTADADADGEREEVAGARETATNLDATVAIEMEAPETLAINAEAGEAAAKSYETKLSLAASEGDTQNGGDGIAADGGTPAAAVAVVEKSAAATASPPLCKDRTRGVAFDVKKPTLSSVFGCAAAHPIIDPPADDQVYRYHEGVCRGPRSIASFIPKASLKKNVAPKDAAAGTEASLAVQAAAAATADAAVGDSLHVLAVPRLPKQTETICLLCFQPERPKAVAPAGEQKEEVSEEDDEEAPPEQGCLILITVHSPHTAAADAKEVQQSEKNGFEGEEDVQQKILTLDDCAGAEEAAGGVATLKAILLPNAPVRFECGVDENHTLLPLQPSLVYDDSDDDCDAHLPSAAGGAAATGIHEDGLLEQEIVQSEPDKWKQERQFLLDDPTEPMSVVVENLRDLVPSARLTGGPFDVPSEEPADAAANVAAGETLGRVRGSEAETAAAITTSPAEPAKRNSKKAEYTLTVSELPTETTRVCYRCKRKGPISLAHQGAKSAAASAVSSTSEGGDSYNRKVLNECRLRITVPSASEVRKAAATAEEEEAQEGISLLLKEPQRKFVLPY